MAPFSLLDFLQGQASQESIYRLVTELTVGLLRKDHFICTVYGRGEGRQIFVTVHLFVHKNEIKSAWVFYYLSIRRRQDSLRHNLTHGVMMREKRMGMGHFVDRWAGNAQRGVGRVECGHVSRRQGVEVRSGALGIYIRPVTYCGRYSCSSFCSVVLLAPLK